MTITAGEIWGGVVIPFVLGSAVGMAFGVMSRQRRAYEAVEALIVIALAANTAAVLWLAFVRVMQ